MTLRQIEPTPIANYAGYRQTLRTSFRKGIPRPVEYRQKQLAQLAYMLQDNYQRFTDALYQDLGKPALEVYMAEVGAAINGALKSAREVADWATPQDVQTDDMWKPFGPKIYKAAKGVVLVIGYAGLSGRRYFTRPNCMHRVSQTVELSMHPDHAAADRCDCLWVLRGC